MSQFSLAEHRQVQVLRVVGELEHGCCESFGSALDAAADAAGEDPLIVDLSRLNHIGSAGIRALMLLRRRLDGQGRRLVLAGMAGPVRETMAISGAVGLFETDDTVDAALDRISEERRNGARHGAV